jgi:hypothetical protein
MAQLEFQPPKEFKIPEGAEPGKPFDVVCTFEPKEGGKLCLTKIGDVDVDYDEKGEQQETHPGYEAESDSMMNAMANRGSANPS